MSQQFSAAPKVVKPKKKYKEEPEVEEEDQIKLIYNNLMWDKRVFRGNTYSAIVVSKKNQNGDDKAAVALRTQKGPQQTMNSFQGNKRANIQIFTDQFVQSLTDKPPKYEYGSQTDALQQNRVIRHRLEYLKGRNIQTQIWDNQLFDFDYEVEPLLNVLCGRTLQISRMEVLQQQELKIMSNRQQQLRLYEKEENKKIQNMYDQQEKLQQQNIKIVQNFKKQKQKKIRTHRKLFSRVIAKQYLRDIKVNTLNYIQANGFFRNPVQLRLISQVLPSFFCGVLQVAHQDQNYIHQSQKILQETKNQIVNHHNQAKLAQKNRRQLILDKRAEKAHQKQERKLMKAEQQYMRKFLTEERIYLEQQEAKRLLQEGQAEGVQQ